MSTGGAVKGIGEWDHERQVLATVPWMPTYQGGDEALLYYDVLGGSSTSQLIVLAGGAARHPEYLGDLAGLSILGSGVCLVAPARAQTNIGVSGS